MDITKLKPIPKSILEQMKKLDKKLYLFPESTVRFYSYLTTLDRELVKVTVAVKTIRDVFYNKQVTVHGIYSKECFVKDLEYNYIIGMGYRTGWYDQFLYYNPKNFEDGKWYPAKRQYYNPYSTLINASYLNRFKNYKHSKSFMAYLFINYFTSLFIIKNCWNGCYRCFKPCILNIGNRRLFNKKRKYCLV